MIPNIGLVVFLVLIGVPLIEIAVLIEVGGQIGLWPTLAVIVATAALGAMLLRRQGISVLANARGSVERGEMPVRALLDGACLVIAAALLLTPGFVTDTAGALLLIPSVRRPLQAGVLRRLAANGKFGGGMSPGRGDAGVVIIEGEFTGNDADEPPSPTNNPPPG